MAAAIQDSALIRRFRELMVYFYDRKGLTREDIQEWLRHL